MLSDPANEDRTAEEVAERVIDALDDTRSRSHRLAVVGQIAPEWPQGDQHTVVLGPFTARGVLDSPEKFERAVSGGTAAREVGGRLAWDTKAGRGRGRFMLAPAFSRPQDAWDYFRGQAGAAVATALEESQERVVRQIEPVCACGLRGHQCPWCHQAADAYCVRHDRGVQHRCTVAA